MNNLLITIIYTYIEFDYADLDQEAGTNNRQYVNYIAHSCKHACTDHLAVKLTLPKDHGDLNKARFLFKSSLPSFRKSSTDLSLSAYPCNLYR